MKTIASFLNKIPKIQVWLLMPVLLLIFNLIAGFNGLYGQDSFEYLRYSRALHSYITEGISPGAFLWPVLYPLTGALFSFFLPDILSLQIVSIVSYGLTIFYLNKTLLYLFPDRKREMTQYVLLFFSLSPFVLRDASVVMSDSLAMFLLTAFLYYYLLFREKGLNRDFIRLVFFAFAAINTRYAAVVVVAIPGIEALYYFIRKFSPGYFFLALLAASVTFLPDVILEISGTPRFAILIFIQNWSAENYFHRSFFSADGNFFYTFPNISFVFSHLINPGYIFPGLFLLFFIRRKTFSKPFILSIILIFSLYALFLAGFPAQNSRLLLLTFPCVILLYSEPFLRFRKRIADFLNFDLKRYNQDLTKKRLKFLLIGGAILVQMALFCRAIIPAYTDGQITREIAYRLKAYPDRTIYTFNIDMGLKEYDVKNDIINIWVERISTFKPGSLVLFNYVNSYRQWKGKNPIINWEKVNKEHEVLLIEKLPDNWNLYEIRN
jgi:hypothetical protein